MSVRLIYTNEIARFTDSRLIDLYPGCSLWLNTLMTTTLILRNQQYEVKHGSTLRVVLLKLQIQPDTVLATRNNELITDDEILRDGDVIKLVSVISGG